MKKIVRLTELDLVRLVKRVIKEEQNEAFLIPKKVRKFMPTWGDEEIGLSVLEQLKDMEATPENVSDLNIVTKKGDLYFDLGEYNFRVSVHGGPMLGPELGYLEMNGDELEVSTEVCRKIRKEINRLKNAEANETRESLKKDFLRTHKK